MKIAIDVSQIVYGTGVSVYTKELVRSLLKVSDIELVLYAGSLRRKDEIVSFVNSLEDNVESKIYSIPPMLSDIVWNRLHILPIDALIGKVDIVHTSDWAEPPSSFPKVTTVHDLSPILYPDETNPRVVGVQKRRLAWVKKESKAIISPSTATKKDLVKLGFDSKRIHVIHEAISTTFEPSKPSQTESTLNKYNIKGKYLLMVGASPRKNVDKIYQSFNKVKSELNLQNLVIVGERTEKKQDLEGILFTGHVSEKELRDLYASAQSLVYVSLYEGFGLPILEAFSSKIPVVTSNLSSMPEAAGKAAVLVDPKDVGDISKGLIEANRTKKLLVKNGVKQLEKFSWSRAAEETVKIYKSLL